MSGPVKDPLRALQGARSRAQGGRLEEQIEASCALLTETGRADISKTPEPMKPVSQPNKSGQFRAVYTKKAEPDFKGVILGGRAVMFEAKSTGTGRLSKDRVLPEQVKKLDSYTALGAHCFIVATFDGLRVYRIPWTVWRSMKQRYGRNYVTEADIKEYAVRFGPGFTPDLLRGIPTMYDINPLSNVSDVLTAFCGMPYGTQPETEEWRAAVNSTENAPDDTAPEPTASPLPENDLPEGMEAVKEYSYLTADGQGSDAQPTGIEYVEPEVQVQTTEEAAPAEEAPVNTTAPATSDAQQEAPASSSDAPSIGETVKRIIIEINGSGSIDVGGMNEESVLDILTRHAKPVLMSIIKGEIFEEGDLAYDF